VLALVLLMLLPSATAAVAEASTSPSVDQYVESVPTAGGDTTTHPGRGGHGQALTPGVKRRIRQGGGSDARKLEAIAVSPALGAPAGDHGRKRSTSYAPRDPAQPSALKAAVTAGTHGDGTAFGWLIAGLLGIGAVAGAAALSRRRSQ
jgi:hypothetical protein